jgi:starch synthase
MNGEKLRILFLTPEAVPFCKSGGLADMAGSLPLALKRLGADVRMVLPRYRSVREAGRRLKPLIRKLSVPLGPGVLEADVLETRATRGLPVYFIDREDLYDRPGLYGGACGDYYDNPERFAFFSHAVLKLAEAIRFRPHLIHCHDWQTGLVPALLKGPYRESPVLGGVRSVFTVHNLGYQGIFPGNRFSLTGLPEPYFFHPDGLEYWGNVSLLKSGLVYADALTTVSPTYALEIQTPEFGKGMEGVLQNRRAELHGILNGADYSLWNPAADPHIPSRFTLNRISGKAACKKALIEEMGLDATMEDRPILGMTSRLDAQKGIDLLLGSIGALRGLDAALVVLGTGEEANEKALLKAARRQAGRVAVRIGFDEGLAHRIVAGSDMFLIPSRYEPCGLTQMYALRYGAAPVARETGGLNDTVTQFDPASGEGNGFKFGPYEPKALVSALRRAVSLFRQPGVWKKVMVNGMRADFSWNRSAVQYLDLFRSLVEEDPSPGN